MLNFFLADRIKETSRVQGTNDISLDGAAPGFSAFKDFYASGDTIFYAITDNSQYEIGSGVFKNNGSTPSITRNPFRSSNINVGPWYVNATSNSGPTNGTTGFFYPLWLTRSAAQSGVGFSSGPFTSASGITFNQYPGVTFYHIAEHSALGVGSLANSGANYAVSGQPVNFSVGLKEVFVTYPGKTSVYNGFGLEPGIKEPRRSGVAFWENEQILNYTSNLVWNNTNGFLGINKSNPSYSIDVGGLMANSTIRASGFIDGGSGVLFSGGQLTDTLLIASGGRQWEPFRRNRKGASAQGVIELSGIVDQIIDFVDQPVGTVFAGPISGVCNPCPDDAPSFRRLVASDLPTAPDLQLSWSMVTQKNTGLDGQTSNKHPNNFIPGMIPIYHSSGNITYDSGIFYDPNNNRLLIGGNASTDTPNYTLDLRGAGTLSAATGIIVTLNSTSGIFSNLQAVSGSINSLLSISGNMNTLTANSGNINVLNAVSGTIAKLFSTSGSFSNLQSVSGIIDNLFVNSGNIIMLVSDSGNIANLSSNSGYFNHIIFNNNLIRVGTNAANNASGIYNVYVGLNAGVAVSGHENIEIVASGSNPSFLTHEASGKINIGNTIVGDIYSARIAVGEPDNVSPSATLYVRPRISSEPAFIIQHRNAGSNTVPYLQLQSGDGTTFYRISNSGDVITSGYLNPSGGILLEPITTSNWMNSTTNRLYNDGGTLKFNGNAITVGGTYSFYLTDGKQTSDEITDAQTVTVSGVSGVEVAYDPTGGGFFRISASGLSGVLQNQITAQTYKFYSVASGYGSNNNSPKEQLSNSYLVVSGVSGVNIDHRNLTDGTNSSGIYIIGYDPTITYSFGVTNGDVASDTISSSQTITISGVSGIRAEYDATNNFFRIGASGLSGVLNATIINSGNALLGTINSSGNALLGIINSSGNFLRGQILQNTASGLAISGIAAYASGQIVNITQRPATSGIKVENNTYITDSGSRGFFNSLMLNNSGSILIGTSPVAEPSVGRHAYSVIIGYGAAANLNNGRSLDSICIGVNAAQSIRGDLVSSILQGFYCGYLASGITNSILQGAGCGELVSGVSDSIIQGRFAGSDTFSVSDSIIQGTSAGRESLYIDDSIIQGDLAGYRASGTLDSIIQGTSAGRESFNIDYSIIQGYAAGYKASGINNTTLKGYYTGVESININNSIFMGNFAGFKASGINNSIFIGNRAGQRASGVNNSISIQNGQSFLDDLQWIGSHNTGNFAYLDIAKSIQGLINPAILGGARLHIGKSLTNPPWTGSTYHSVFGITDSALTLTPPSQNNSALKLFFHTTDGSTASQTVPLLRTQSKPTGTIIPHSPLNTIVNENGFLRIPVATSRVGASASTIELQTSENITITKGAGVFAIYQMFDGTGIAICIGNAPNFTWYKLDTISTFTPGGLPG